MVKGEDVKKLVEQILKFGIVGILATLLDFFLLFLLTEVAHIYYLVSSCISFLVSLVFNYFASMKYVFSGKEDMSKGKEFTIFVILSIIGLGINQLGMWFMVNIVHIFYMLSKIVVTAIVMMWNFVSRKILLEE